MQKSQFAMLLAALFTIAAVQFMVVLMPKESVQQGSNQECSQECSVDTEIQGLSDEEKVEFLCANVPEAQLSSDEIYQCKLLHMDFEMRAQGVENNLPTSYK